jgi:hypothetical protein
MNQVVELNLGQAALLDLLSFRLACKMRKEFIENWWELLHNVIKLLRNIQLCLFLAIFTVMTCMIKAVSGH